MIRGFNLRRGRGQCGGEHSNAFYAATKAWRRANRPKVYYSFVMTAGRFRKLMSKQMYLVLRSRRLYS